MSICPAPPSASLTISRFPRLQECAHFHYEVSTVDLPKNFRFSMSTESETAADSAKLHTTTVNTTTTPNANSNNNNNSSSSNTCAVGSGAVSSGTTPSAAGDSQTFHIHVTCNDKRWVIYRTYENFKYLDKFLHECIFDRKFSSLQELTGDLDVAFEAALSSVSKSASSSAQHHNNKQKNKNSEAIKQLRLKLVEYLNRLGEIIFVNPINCGPILNWFEASEICLLLLLLF